MTTQDTETQWQSLRQAFMRSWNQLRQEVKTHWERLTEDDIADIEGRLGRLRDKISERYGVAQSDAEMQIREWVARDVPWLQQVRTVPSFRWTVISFVTAAITAILGFTNLADLIQAFSRWLFWVALVAFVVFLVIHLSMRRRVHGPERISGPGGIAGPSGGGGRDYPPGGPGRTEPL